MIAERFEQIQRLLRKRPEKPLDLLLPGDFAQDWQWRTDLVNWSQEVFLWHKSNLDLKIDDDSVAVTMYGVPAPCLRLARRADGVIVRVDEGDAGGATEWFELLELPPPRAKIDPWLERNQLLSSYPVRWGIQGRLRIFAADNGMPFCKDSRWPDLVFRLEVKWAEELRRLADYRAVRRLRRLTGPVEFTTIAEHNMAVLCGDLLQKLSRTNPGAVGWWLASVRRKHIPQYQIPIRWNETRSLPAPPELPAHPGEIIARVQEEFRQAGGRHWKSLIRQPSRDVYALLTEFPAEVAASVVDALAQSPPDPARPGRRSLPPGWVKKQLAHTYKRIQACRDDGPRRNDAIPALERVVHLAVREFAGYAGQPFRFDSVADYAVIEPAAARRRGNWDALWNAAAQWHRELEANRRGGSQRDRDGGGADPEWGGALTEWTDADFRARLLTSAGALRAESDLMRHCVGSAGYDLMCRQGDTRIFHLEPLRLDAGDKSAPRRQATTVALERGADGWQVVQQRGFANRRASKKEANRGRRLAQAYTRAERRAAGSPAAGEGAAI